LDRQSQPQAQDTAVTPPASGPDTPPPEPSDLASRLQPLRAAIDSFGRSAAHPSDLRNHGEFIQAVELLLEPSVSVATLVRVSVSTREMAHSADQRVAPPMNLSSAAARSATVVRRYRFGSAPLVRDAVANWRSGRAKDVMAGNFDLLGIVALD
jgi:hypothetical protein